MFLSRYFALTVSCLLLTVYAAPPVRCQGTVENSLSANNHENAFCESRVSTGVSDAAYEQAKELTDYGIIVDHAMLDFEARLRSQAWHHAEDRVIFRTRRR
ncbi:hypothetical protein BT96DRAFT_934729 [Gymnopus androsaceus JB14]|uniref:Uncharacterized protein n=1 Tax=Gymnopus androsaceus JB14 TaxID=1447944 RepID=A0A6A4I732_9AGAR|nr:hypothetical protein BT96DRAFT_934729 [Gymnopus androsaceus JB14]